MRFSGPKVTLGLGVALLLAAAPTSAFRVLPVAGDPQGNSTSTINKQTVVWRDDPGPIATSSTKWRQFSPESGGCPVGSHLCQGPIESITVRSDGNLTVSFSADFSGAPVAVKVTDNGHRMHPGPAVFRAGRTGQQSFSYTWVSKPQDTDCRELTFYWRSMNGERVLFHASATTIQYKLRPSELACSAD